MTNPMQLLNICCLDEWIVAFKLFFPHLTFEQIVEEAGGAVTCMDGRKFCVFDRSVLVSNGVLHAKVSTNVLSFTTDMVY